MMTDLLAAEDTGDLRSRLMRVQNLVRAVGREALAFRESAGTS